MFKYFSKTCRESSRFIKNVTRITGTLHEDRYTYLVIPRSVFLKTNNVLGKSFREYQNTHFVFTNIFRKSRFFLDNVIKYGEDGRATDDNMLNAHCVLDA